MWEGIGIGIVTGAVMILINALVRRAGVKTKQDTIIEDLQELKEGNRAVLTVIKPMIVAIKGDEHNGDLIAAEKVFDKYLINK